MTSMFFKLFSVFLIIPIIELYLLIKIGGIIGALNTVLIILITASLGRIPGKKPGLPRAPRDPGGNEQGICAWK